MDAEFLKQTESVYHAALEVEESRRVIFLREACGSDEALFREVESLLCHGKRAVDFLEVPAMELAGLTLTLKLDEVQHPSFPVRIGSYRILRVLGEGGMGVVYEAEQEHPCRIVALKVIRAGSVTPELLRRFEQESQALARLQHPGIAQIFEAGTANAGFGPQLWFAMEFIRGESLLQYAQAHRLNTRQRLQLMAKVCEAVHHAHQRGIIHRDLKPANILVDEGGQPKILDFGVARVTDSDAQATRQTDAGQIVGTLAYMSPEQVLADPLELDTRSDVYALGVILFELLAGCLPYKISGQLHDAVRTIREEDPAPLSSISRVYRGDIETIVATALEKDKNRRYASAAGMAGDIRRYMNDEPITARPASAAYQLRKFTRRHKALVAGAAAVFVVLIAGIIASSLEAERARRAEQTARTESATTTAVNDFLQNDLLAQASANVQAQPDTKPDPDLKVRTALDRAAMRIEGKFKEQPLVEASIHQTIGKTYGDLGLYPEAQRQLEHALDLRRRVLGEEHPDTLGTMNDLAYQYLNQGKYAQTEPLYTKVLEIRRRVLGAEHPGTLTSMNDLGYLYLNQGEYARAEPLFARALEARRRVLGEGHPDTLISMHDLALLYWQQGKYAQAEPLDITVLEMRRRALGAEHPSTLSSMNNLALIYEYQGKYAKAEPLFARVFEVFGRVLGSEHADTLTAMNNLALLYRDQGRDAEAEPLLTRALEGRRRVLGVEHPDTLSSMNNLAALYRDEHKYARAELLYTRLLEVSRRALSNEHPYTLSGMHGLALLYSYEGKYTQAEPLLTKVVVAWRRTLGDKHPRTLIGMNELAYVYLYQKKYAQAEALGREALDGHQKGMTSTWDRYSCQSFSSQSY